MIWRSVPTSTPCKTFSRCNALSHLNQPTYVGCLEPRQDKEHDHSDTEQRELDRHLEGAQKPFDRTAENRGHQNRKNHEGPVTHSQIDQG